MSWYDYIPSPIGQAINGLTGGTPFGVDPSKTLGIGSGDPSNPYRQGVVNNAQAGGAFGQYGVGQYQQNQAGLNQSINDLRATANGQNSVSALQLSQGLQQNLAAQNSMAASASPQNAAMAARTASIQGGRLGAGLAGQQAVAGLQERQQAQQALAQLQLGQSGQNLQAGLGGYGMSNQGYGIALGNPQQTWGQVAQRGLAALGPAIIGAM